MFKTTFACLFVLLGLNQAVFADDWDEEEEESINIESVSSPEETKTAVSSEPQEESEFSFPVYGTVCRLDWTWKPARLASNDKKIPGSKVAFINCSKSRDHLSFETGLSLFSECAKDEFQQVERLSNSTNFLATVEKAQKRLKKIERVRSTQFHTQVDHYIKKGKKKVRVLLAGYVVFHNRIVRRDHTILIDREIVKKGCHSFDEKMLISGMGKLEEKLRRVL